MSSWRDVKLTKFQVDKILHEEPNINNKLVSSKKSEAGDGVWQGSKNHNPTMLILTNKRGLKLNCIESYNQVGLM